MTKTTTYDDKQWQLVPKRMTDEMNVAAIKAISDFHHSPGDYADAGYDAALAAAPATPQQAPALITGPSGKNAFGLDARYFHEKLSLIVRDIMSFRPEEMSVTLCRLADADAPHTSPQPLPGRVLDANDVYTTVAVGSEDAYCREHGARRVWVGDVPVCGTCNGHGMIGGPSYREPDESGVPCPQCSPTNEMIISVRISDDVVAMLAGTASFAIATECGASFRELPYEVIGVRGNVERAELQPAHLYHSEPDHGEGV